MEELPIEQDNLLSVDDFLLSSRSLSDFVITQRKSAYALRLSNYVLVGLLLLCQIFQFGFMITRSNTSLWLEVVWTLFQFVVPGLQLWFMIDPYMQANVLLHDMWMTWVANALFTVLTVMNWDYFFGKTAKYFNIASDAVVEQAAIASLVFAILSSISFTVYCYIAKEDYEASQDSIISELPLDM